MLSTENPTCTSSSDLSQWINPTPMSFNEWKSILSEWTTPKTTKPPTSASEAHHRSNSPGKRQDRAALPRNQVFGDAIVDSFLISPSSNLLQSSISLTRQDVPKLVTPPNKRYVSSFKTISNGASSRQPQRVSYINDSVLILKLSKGQSVENNEHGGSSCNKYSSFSMASSVSIKSAKVPSAPAPPAYAFPPRLSPILKVEGQKRRIVHHDSSLIAPSTGDLAIAGSSTNPMSTSTSNHPQSNSSLFTYRSAAATPAAAAAGGNINRLRAMPDPATATNSLFISTEKLKSNMASSLRSTRPPLMTTSSMPSALTTSQQMQRSAHPNSRSRGPMEKYPQSRENSDYPDPFANCPQDILSKLAQMTKLQLETIEWEKKKRFTKRKPIAHGVTHGKDSP